MGPSNCPSRVSKQMMPEALDELSSCALTVPYCWTLHMGLTLMVMLPLTIAAPAGSAPRFLNAH